MPLNTQIIRDGETLKIPWSGFHVVAMTVASVYDSGEGPFVDNSPPDDQPEKPTGITPGDVWNLMGYHILATTPLNKGRYTLKKKWKFVDTTDGEEFELLPGDVLCAWRN